MADNHNGSYYVPAPSLWPITGSIGLFLLVIGAGNWIHKNSIGMPLFFLGSLVLAFMLFGWFGTVIRENRAGKLANPLVERSFQWGLAWFIFTEVVLFACLFAVLFYARIISVPVLAGSIRGEITHILLWPTFQGGWPLLANPNPAEFPGSQAGMSIVGIPMLNTLVLLLSGICITFAYWGVLKNRRWQMSWGILLTILFGIAFLFLQANEYWMAYTEKGLKLSSGIYGSTFFMLTGLDAVHVVVGVIMLAVILWRILKGDFNSQDHFGFMAAFWYWHFVEFIWLALFIFVYWM